MMQLKIENGHAVQTRCSLLVFMKLIMIICNFFRSQVCAVAWLCLCDVVPSPFVTVAVGMPRRWHIGETRHIGKAATTPRSCSASRAEPLTFCRLSGRRRRRQQSVNVVQHYIEQSRQHQDEPNVRQRASCTIGPSETWEKTPSATPYNAIQKCCSGSRHQPPVLSGAVAIRTCSAGALRHRAKLEPVQHDEVRPKRTEDIAKHFQGSGNAVVTRRNRPTLA